MTHTTITKQIRLEQHSPSYWSVTFDQPPLNIFGPQNVPQLNEIITALETDEQAKVVVFDSAGEGFFLTHYDFPAKLETRRVCLSVRPACSRYLRCWRASAAFRSSP